MQDSLFLKNKGKSSHLLVLVLGWAACPSSLEGFCTEVQKEFPQSDILLLWGYPEAGLAATLTLPVEFSFFESYAQVTWLAWSFGVWASEVLLSSPKGRALSSREGFQALALNGTPCPAHKNWGIAPKKIELTLKGAEKRGVMPFYAACYGSLFTFYEESLLAFLKKSPPLAPQLAWLLEQSAPALPQISDKAFIWKACFISPKDAIFPAEACHLYWSLHSPETCLLDLTESTPHFAFDTLLPTLKPFLS